jgi:gliding motility-associated-like protein
MRKINLLRYLPVFYLLQFACTDLMAQCNNIFTFSITTTPATCLAADGNIGVSNVTGGSGNYTFSLNNGPFTGPAVPPNNHAFPNLSAGVYVITISDGTCDTTVTATVSVTGGVVSANAVTTPTSCTGSTGSITVSHLPAAINVVNYILSPPAAPNNATGIFNNLAAGTYSVILEDVNGCPFSINGIVINAPQPITDVTLTVTPIVCKGALGIITVSGVTGGTSPFQYQFDNNPPSGATVFNNVLEGVHTIKVTDNNGCTFSKGVIMTGSTTQLTDCNAGKDTTIFFGENAQLNAIKGVGSRFYWAPGESLSDSSLLSPIAFPVGTTTYTFTTRTPEGCTCIDRVTVKVIPVISMPNTFTPNQDGTNDIWIINNTEHYEDVNLYIYNRWGDRVYFVKNYKTGNEWDGGSLPEATYYYVLRFKYPGTDERFEYTGGITIIR